MNNAIVGLTTKGKFRLVSAVTRKPILYGDTIYRAGYANDDEITGGSPPSISKPYGTVQFNHKTTIILSETSNFVWEKV